MISSKHTEELYEIRKRVQSKKVESTGKIPAE
jgi:hypothetical protein